MSTWNVSCARIVAGDSAVSWVMMKRPRSMGCVPSCARAAETLAASAATVKTAAGQT